MYINNINDSHIWLLLNLFDQLIIVHWEDWYCTRTDFYYVYKLTSLKQSLFKNKDFKNNVPSYCTQNLPNNYLYDDCSLDLLSELSGPVLFRGSLNFCSCITCFLNLDDLVGINRVWLYKEPKASVLQVNAHLTQKGEWWTWNQRFATGQGSIPTRGNIHFVTEFFLFSCSKSSDANIGIFANVVCLWKTQLVNKFGRHVVKIKLFHWHHDLPLPFLSNTFLGNCKVKYSHPYGFSMSFIDSTGPIHICHGILLHTEV